MGLIGDQAARARLRFHLVRLGASPVEPGMETIWDAAQPVIELYDCDAVDDLRRPMPCLHLIVGAGEPNAQRAEADLWSWETDIERLWRQRLVPFEASLRAAQRAPRRQEAVLAGPDPTWPDHARRLMERLSSAVGDSVIRIDHIGSTSVPGLPAKELIDIQVVVDDLAHARQVAGAARRAGFVHATGPWFGTDGHGTRHPAEVVVDADPGRPVNVNIRPVSASVWRETLLFRDWLRAHDAERDAYAAIKRELAARRDSTVDDYGEDKMPWIRSALERAKRWASERQ
ncbi:MAG: GrpB family protein [Acidimicrobiales bacterium]